VTPEPATSRVHYGGTVIDSSLQISVSVGAIIGFLGLAVTFVVYSFKISAAYTRLEVEVKRMVDPAAFAVVKMQSEENYQYLKQVGVHLLELGRREALKEHVVMKNSPETVVPVEVKRLYEKHRESLRRFYETEGHKMEDWQLFLALSNQFKDDFTEEVCRPLKLDAGGCTYAAMLLLKEEYAGVPV
jgi:hypothetical protein